MTAAVTQRIRDIEEALARCLPAGDFEIVRNADGERFLRPILRGHVMEDAIWSYPLLSLEAAARRIERFLS